MSQIPASIRPALERYAERLRGRFGDRLRSVVLFGSFARGEAHEDSDVDILAVIDGLTDLEAWQVAGEIAPVAIETGPPPAPGYSASARGNSTLFSRCM